MQNSSVLLVNPHHYHHHHHHHPTVPTNPSSPVAAAAAASGRASGIDMSKLNMRHYSLESPSLTSPPAYDILLPGAVGGAAGGAGGGDLSGKHPCGGFSAGPIGSQGNVMGAQLPIASSPQFNPHLVMAPTAPPGLLHICEYY